MVHDATAHGSIRAGLTDEQREQLDRLERVRRPTGQQRGQLAALKLCGADAQRVAEIRERWDAGKGQR